MVQYSTVGLYSKFGNAELLIHRDFLFFHTKIIDTLFLPRVEYLTHEQKYTIAVRGVMEYIHNTLCQQSVLYFTIIFLLDAATYM